MTATIDTTPRVWIGCLQCYNEGNLVGDWYSASEADKITTSKVHERVINPGTHEELWCLDHENLPITGGVLHPMRPRSWPVPSSKFLKASSQPLMPGCYRATTSKMGTGCRASATLKSVTAENGHRSASMPSSLLKTQDCSPTCPRQWAAISTGRHSHATSRSTTWCWTQARTASTSSGICDGGQRSEALPVFRLLAT